MSPPAHPPTLVRALPTQVRAFSVWRTDYRHWIETKGTNLTGRSGHSRKHTGSVGVGGDLVPIKAQAGDRIYEPLTYRPSFVGFNHRIVPGTD